MKILFISSWALFGGTRFGGAKRLYYFARELECRVELHLLCLDGCQEWPPGEAFPSEFRRRLVLPMHPERPLWRRAAFLPAGVVEVLAAHRGAIDAFLGDARFDATLLAFPFSLAFLPWCRRERMGKQVYLEDDLLLESYRRHARSPSLPRKAKGLIRYRQALAYFREGLRDGSDFICISREEEEVVRPIFPALRTHVLKYGLPLCDYPCLPAPADRNVLGFIGNYRHSPNLDALNWLVDELFPHMARNAPGARLVLGGMHFPQEIKDRCARLPGVTLFEDVQDLSRFYAGMGVFINPLRQGRGLRTKVVEAAAYGRPVISTALGAEGLEELRIGVAETKEGFLAAFQALAVADRWREAALRNRRAVESAFSVEALGARLEEILAP